MPRQPQAQSSICTQGAASQPTNTKDLLRAIWS